MNRQYVSAFKDSEGIIAHESRSLPDTTHRDALYTHRSYCANCLRVSKCQSNLAGFRIFSFILLQLFRSRGECINSLENKVSSLKRANRRTEDELQFYHNRHNGIIKRNENLLKDLTILKQECAHESYKNKVLMCQLSALQTQYDNLKQDYENMQTRYALFRQASEAIEKQLRREKEEITRLRSRLQDARQNSQRLSEDYRTTLGYLQKTENLYYTRTRDYQKIVLESIDEISKLNTCIEHLTREVRRGKKDRMSYNKREIQMEAQIHSLTNELNAKKEELNKSITNILKKIFLKYWQRWLNVQKKTLNLSHEILFNFLPAVPPPKY